ncbi:aminoglycoside phosphotransferase domain protein [Brucella rhizosphaerae]|uniref:Aminoglycoside phosphotransferase domain protein n=2 Tax=Brucella rhizosphaerae TaxID=571254 RepID=A0A256FTQ8_9HYPH|nr:aminoglycoside phosphotransferase domain protein [Brucella rhizosphaerae]
MAPLSTTQAQTLTLQHFGISGQVTELGGERTQNFLIRTVDGSGFTLKVSDPLESLDGVELESAALLHIESVAPEITAPRVVQALDGE